MQSIRKASVAILLGISSALAFAQSDLGALLDAGAERVSPASFREDVVQRVLVGPAPNGGTQELIYTQGGLLHGVGRAPVGAGGAPSNRQVLSGEWIVDDMGRVCGTMRSNSGAGSNVAANVVLPFRCRYWFRLGDTYFVSDSDVDRRAKVLSRKISK